MSFKVLVVDGTSFVRDTVRRTLRNLYPHADIHDASNAKKAISMLKKTTMDLILSEWEMDDMSGKELVAWVRENMQEANPGFIVLSGQGGKEHVVDAIQSGVNDYIVKPFTPEELKIKVAKQLSKRGLGAAIPKVKGNSLAAETLSALTGGNPAKAEVPKKVAKRISLEGSAIELVLPDEVVAGELKNVSLQAANLEIALPKVVPALFQTLAFNITKKTDIGPINGYVHGLTAATLSPDAKKIKLIVRFANNNEQTLDKLSQYVS